MSARRPAPRDMSSTYPAAQCTRYRQRLECMHNVCVVRMCACRMCACYACVCVQAARALPVMSASSWFHPCSFSETAWSVPHRFCTPSQASPPTATAPWSRPTRASHQQVTQQGESEPHNHVRSIHTEHSPSLAQVPPPSPFITFSSVVAKDTLSFVDVRSVAHNMNPDDNAAPISRGCSCTSLHQCAISQRSNARERTSDLQERNDVAHRIPVRGMWLHCAGAA